MRIYKCWQSLKTRCRHAQAHPVNDAPNQSRCSDKSQPSIYSQNHSGKITEIDATYALSNNRIQEIKE